MSELLWYYRTNTYSNVFYNFLFREKKNVAKPGGYFNRLRSDIFSTLKLYCKSSQHNARLVFQQEFKKQQQKSAKKNQPADFCKTFSDLIF